MNDPPLFGFFSCKKSPTNEALRVHRPSQVITCERFHVGTWVSPIKHEMIQEIGISGLLLRPEFREKNQSPVSNFSTRDFLVRQFLKTRIYRLKFLNMLRLPFSSKLTESLCSEGCWFYFVNKVEEKIYYLFFISLSLSLKFWVNKIIIKLQSSFFFNNLIQE